MKPDKVEIALAYFACLLGALLIIILFYGVHEAAQRDAAALDERDSIRRTTEPVSQN